MYINKNNGKTIVEVIISMVIISLLMVSLVGIFKILLNVDIKERDESYKNITMEKIVLEIEKNMEIAVDFKIINYSFYLPNSFQYPKKSLSKGNILIINHNYLEEHKLKECVSLFYLNQNLLTVFPGFIENGFVFLNKNESTVISKKISGHFLKENYLIILKGEVSTNEFRKEF